MIESKLVDINDISITGWRKIEKQGACIFGSTYDYVKAYSDSGLRNYMCFTVYDDEVLVGGLFFQLYTSFTKKMLTSIGGPVVQHSYVEIVLNELYKFIRSNKKKYLFSLTFIPQQCLKVPIEMSRYILKNPNETTIIYFNKSVESIYKGFRKGRKGDLNYAEKLLVVKELNELDEWIKTLDIINEHSKRNHFSANVNKELFNYFYRMSNKMKFLGAFNTKGKMVGCAVFQYSHPNGVHLLFLAREYESFESKYSESFLIWSAIKLFHEQGSEYLNLSGLPPKSSSRGGIRYFKLSFGGTLVNYIQIETSFLRRSIMNVYNKGRILSILIDKIMTLY